MKRILKNIMHKTFIFATLFIVLRIWIANEIIVKLIWTNVIIFYISGSIFRYNQSCKIFTRRLKQGQLNCCPFYFNIIKF